MAATGEKQMAIDMQIRVRTYATGTARQRLAMTRESARLVSESFALRLTTICGSCGCHAISAIACTAFPRT
jgi:hypothetical protein